MRRSHWPDRKRTQYRRTRTILGGYAAGSGLAGPTLQAPADKPN